MNRGFPPCDSRNGGGVNWHPSLNTSVAYFKDKT